MDKRSDDIRQDIESTRASLDEKIDLLQNKATEVVDQAKQTFDVKRQISERPWVALGLALAAGYAVGNMGNNKSSSYSSSSYSSMGVSSDYNQHAYSGPSTMDNVKAKGRDFLSQFDEEIDLLKVAAMTTLASFIRDAAREAVPALAPQIDKLLNERGLGDTNNGSSFGSGMNSGMGSSYNGMNSGSSFGSSGSSMGSGMGSSGMSGSSYDSGSTVSAGSSSGTSLSGEHGSFSRTTAPNVSMDVDANAGRVNHDAMPQFNRYGNPPPTPSRDDQDYYTTYQPDEDQREVGGDDKTRY